LSASLTPQADPLAPLLAPLTSLPGIGPALAERFARVLDGARVLDLTGAVARICAWCCRERSRPSLSP
jgi:hypothetical protein